MTQDKHTTFANECPLFIHTCTACPLLCLRDVISHTWEKGNKTDRQKETHRKTGGSATANVSKARVSKNRGAAIQMDNTTSNKQQQQWQLHLPAAVFHMLMLVLLPANERQKTMCVILCMLVCFCECLFQMKRCTRHSVPHGIGKSHLVGLWTHAHVHT